MELKETLKVEMVAALKSVGHLDGKEKETAQVRLATLRAALGSITEAETSGKTRKELNDTEVIAVLRKMSKQRADSAETYAGANEIERSNRELAEIEVLEEFLPKMLDEAGTRALVESIIAEKGLEGPRAIGQVMGALKGRTDVDTGLASKIARELL